MDVTGHSMPKVMSRAVATHLKRERSNEKHRMEQDLCCDVSSPCTRRKRKNGNGKAGNGVARAPALSFLKKLRKLKPFRFLAKPSPAPPKLPRPIGSIEEWVVSTLEKKCCVFLAGNNHRVFSRLDWP